MKREVQRRPEAGWLQKDCARLIPSTVMIDVAEVVISADIETQSTRFLAAFIDERPKLVTWIQSDYGNILQFLKLLRELNILATNNKAANPHPTHSIHRHSRHSIRFTTIDVLLSTATKLHIKFVLRRSAT